MIQNLAIRSYNTTMLYSVGGQTNSEATTVATSVSSVWDPLQTPTNAFASVETKLNNSYAKVGSPVTGSNEYFIKPNGSGGNQLVCKGVKSIVVTLNGENIAVEMTWEEV